MPKGVLYTDEPFYDPREVFYNMDLHSDEAKEAEYCHEVDCDAEEEVYVSGDEMEEPVPDGQEYESPPRTLKRTRSMREMEGDKFIDLAQFFGSIPAAQQISICRAYGSYLASIERAKVPSKPRTYHKTGLYKAWNDPSTYKKDSK